MSKVRRREVLSGGLAAWRKSHWLGLAAAFLLLAGGCYEPIEGCLDVRAINFDLQADRPCDECCNYPALRFLLQHQYMGASDTASAPIGFGTSVYTDAAGQPFRINDLSYYISEVRLLHPDGTESGVENEIMFNVATGGDTTSMVFEDNFLLVRARANVPRAVGNIREPRPIIAIRFLLGLNADAARAVPASLPNQHPLALQPDSSNYEPGFGYLFKRLSLFRDTVATDTIPRIIRTGSPSPPTSVILPLATEFSPLEGANLNIIIAVNLAQWLADVNVRTDTDAQIIEKINNRIPNGFRLVGIQSVR